MSGCLVEMLRCRSADRGQIDAGFVGSHRTTVFTDFVRFGEAEIRRIARQICLGGRGASYPIGRTIARPLLRMADCSAASRPIARPKANAASQTASLEIHDRLIGAKLLRLSVYDCVVAAPRIRSFEWSVSNDIGETFRRFQSPHSFHCKKHLRRLLEKPSVCIRSSSEGFNLLFIEHLKPNNVIEQILGASVYLLMTICVNHIIRLVGFPYSAVLPPFRPVLSHRPERSL
jgi:hypothetical protein